MSKDRRQDRDGNEDNEVLIPGGLHTDSSLVNQPPGTTRFVMTGVPETKEGDYGFLACEESNEKWYDLPTGFIPIGKVYIGEENTLLFLANPNGDSAMAIADKEDNLRVVFNDEDQPEKMGFKVSQQIDATFRLRKGCERTVYWVDPKPRTFIIDKPEDFKTIIIDKPEDFKTRDWNINKFSLSKTYKSIPKVNNLEVLDTGGILPPGSYNFSIQYLDQDFNPTEFIMSTEVVKVYNDQSNLNFRSIRGATKQANDYLDYPDSTKAIRLVLDPNSLDLDFPFYRVAITEANTGSGIISDTKYSAEISTRNNIFIYTGSNYESIGTQAEVTAFQTVIDEATSIEQIENRLLLGDTKGVQTNLCLLQKYASKISTDMILRDVIISSKDRSNPKDPVLDYHGIGYMPGEIYSLAIVYIFEDNTLSPAYHIPGKNNAIAEFKMYSQGANVLPMSNNDNTCEDTQYLDNNSCGADEYWGVDCEGETLTGKGVRHHRFPLRTDHNIPLVTKISAENSSQYIKKLLVVVTGTAIPVPLVCDEGEVGCTGDTYDTYPVIDIEVQFTEDTVAGSFVDKVDRFDFNRNTGEPTTSNVNWILDSPVIYGLDVDVIQIIETVGTTITTLTPAGPPVPNTSGFDVYTIVSGVTNLTYTITVSDSVSTTEEELYTTQIFGLKFSNIQIPTVEDSGKKIIGYYIVRQERTEDQKTILDSAILTPSLKYKQFAAHGLLFPQTYYPVSGTVATPIQQYTPDYSEDIVGFISPEHKFNDAKYANFTKIIQQGDYIKEDVIISRSLINDVADGSGYVSGQHKSGESDDDGFSLQIKTRDNYTRFAQSTYTTLVSDDIKEVFYLDALEDKLIKDSDDKSVNVFNLATDNKIGMISLKDKDKYPYLTTRDNKRLPYVYLYRENLNPYSNFRVDPYYKQTTNPQSFDGGICEVFGGDSYINAIKYVNSIYFDTRIKKRKAKSSGLNIVLGALLLIGAVVFTILTLGAGSVAAVAALGLAASLLTAVGSTLLLSGIKQKAWEKVYKELYAKGLRNTIGDEYMHHDVDLNFGVNGWRGFDLNPSDDEIQWLGEAINVWFESGVNFGLRHGNTIEVSDFIDAPSIKEEGINAPEKNYEYYGIFSVRNKGDLLPTTALDTHMVNKLTYIDYKRKSYRAYLGVAVPEMYLINPDYKRINKQKAFNHLPIEYDCCSDCQEEFPHRFHWSEQSFQEELTDNFRIFLPNNYKDLEAESGPITDIYRIQNNIYIHTTEGLWHCPQTFQERVTSDIVSFIGTGEYFSLPPRKMVDDSNSSAGNRHKWARIKTKFGILFPSAKEKKWYIFDGQKLSPISDNGNSNYFKNYMDFAVEKQYYDANGINYPYSNNPSNILGVGFLSTYDTNKERLIVTKKDFKITNLPTTPHLLCTDGKDSFIFNNPSSIIATQEGLGWTYKGLENCKMKFQRQVSSTYTDYVNKLVTIGTNTNIYVILNTSGDFQNTIAGTAEMDGAYINANLSLISKGLIYGLQNWAYLDLQAEGWQGTMKFYRTDSERWLSYPDIVPLIDRADALFLIFTNEANPTYHGAIADPMTSPTLDYMTDFSAFTTVGGVHSTYTKFNALIYASPANSFPSAPTLPNDGAMIQHVVGAIKGRDLNASETTSETGWYVYTAGANALIKSSLLDNPYKGVLNFNGDAGLEEYGWVVNTRLGVDRKLLQDQDCINPISGPTNLLTQCEINQDVRKYFGGVEVIEIQREVFTTETMYIDGTPFTPEIENHSWTMSYYLKKQEWIGWHPYLPDFYFHVQEKFYGWKNGLAEIYKFNRPNHYRTFFETTYPFIVEMVDNSDPLRTKVTDHLLFQTEAKKFDIEAQEYFDQDVTFSKVLLYNTFQISGVMNIIKKANEASNYLMQQTKNNSMTGSIILDRNERDWTINNLRDMRVDNTAPMFIRNYADLQANYYIDKIVNASVIDLNKDWTQQESFRDKFLVVRFIFDTFVDTRLIFNFSAFNKKPSER